MPKLLICAHDIDWRDVQRRLDDGVYLKDIALSLGMDETTLRRKKRKAGAVLLMPKRTRRSGHWKGGRRVNSAGYVAVWAPDHPNSRNGYVLEHRLVMEEKVGRFLERQEVVHHVNNDKTDNRPENLELFPNNAAHVSATRKGVPLGPRRLPTHTCLAFFIGFD